MEDDTTRQVDEIESLSSIYDKQWKIEDEAGRSFSVDIADSLKLYVTLPYNYPSQAPPIYLISAPELSHGEKEQISRILEETYLENIGETVIFQWVEALRSYINEKTELLKKTSSPLSTDDDEFKNVTDNFCSSNSQDKQKNENLNLPEIYHGEVIVDRKSTFQGHAVAVISVTDVKQSLAVLYENKKIANATHNIYAYRILKGDKCIVQDCEDDGESQAGQRLMHLLQIMNLTGVLVVVSRWYGGIHLGPDRFRHINNAARQVLTAAGFINKK